MPHSQSRLLSAFRDTVMGYGDRPAVVEGGETITYRQLGCRAASIRQALGDYETGEPIGLLFPRSADAYAAMLAAISAGRPYVPLNMSYPQARLESIIAQAGIRQVIGSDPSTPALVGIEYLCVDTIEPLDDHRTLWEPREGSGIAYTLFTSGSTGEPKGVPISYDNLWAFTRAITETIPLLPEDRCTQVSELSFDFSVHEIYAALLSGACLYPAGMLNLFNPAKYIRDHDLTVWISVPTLAKIALTHRKEDDDLTSVRLSVFNGEALTDGIASDWAKVTDGEVWNNYGPTECSVAVTAQLWDTGDGADLTEAGVVSIGQSLPGCEVGLLIEEGVVSSKNLAPGMRGELLLSGPQMFGGYSDQTLPSPFVEDDTGERWYKTGDLARWRDERFYHLGRTDHQVKIGGFRIELQEIEHRLRSFLGREELAVIAYPKEFPTELVLFVTEALDRKIDRESIGLPAYMLPKRNVTLDQMPMTAHGKLDRLKLNELVG